MAEKKKAPKGTLKKVGKLISGYKLSVALSFVFAAVQTALTLYIPLLFGRCIDLMPGIGAVDHDGIGKEFLTCAALTAVCALGTWLMSTLNNRVTYNVVRDLRNDLYRKLNRLPLRTLDGHPTGDLVNRMASDADTLADGLLLGATQLFTGLLTIAGTLYFLIKINGMTALAVAVLTPVSLFVARFIANHSYRYFSAQSVVKAEQSALINEVTSSLKAVKAFGQEKKYTEKFGKINENLRRTSLKAIFYSSLTNPCTRFVNSVVYAAVAFVGASAVLGHKGGMTVGMLTCALSYANKYTKPFNEISSVAAELQNALACAARVFEITEAAEETADPPAEFSAPFTGDVELSSVYFSYDPAKPLIRDFTAHAAKGQKIAVVGATGCGKTTLINLLMRFYDPDGGTIRMDGKDITEIPRKTLRASFGMVLQDTWLMPGTVRENIAFGKPGATDEEIIEAAKAARAWSFIRRLPQGLDTVLGEDGGALSEGQKQLLCITRVMLCRPPVLILDEATSSVDTRTERKIQEAFDALMQGRTSFIVAHRLSTVMNADLILVMDHGRLAEQGTHEELMRLGGIYAELVRKIN